MSKTFKALMLALIVLSLLSCACFAEDGGGTQTAQMDADFTEPGDTADGTLTHGDFEYVLVQQRGFIGIVTTSTAVITAYKGDESQVEVPGEIEGIPVTGVAAGAFKNAFSLRKLTLPRTTALQDGAFEGCLRLSEVEFTGEGDGEANPAAFTNTPYGLKLLAAANGIDGYELPGEAAAQAESASEGGKTRGAGHTVGVIAGIIIVVAAALAYFVVLPKAREKAQSTEDDAAVDDSALKLRKNLTESEGDAEDETVSDSEIEQSAQKSLINELRAKGAAKMAEVKAKFDTAAVKTRKNLQTAAEDAEAAAEEISKETEAAAEELSENAEAAAEEAAAKIDEALSLSDETGETKGE